MLVVLVIGVSATVALVSPAQAQTTALQCTGQTAVPPLLRAEGTTELVGDVVISCKGGTPLGVGAVVPTANITMFFPTSVTSRIVAQTASGPLTEANLLVDEPSPATQVACPTVTCSAAVPPGGDPYDGQTWVDQNSVTHTDYNEFSAVLGVLGNPRQTNALTWFGVPIEAPGEGTLTLRFTDVRVNASGLGGSGALPTQVPTDISVSGGSAGLPINNAQLTVGFVLRSLTSSVFSAPGVRGPSSVPQCGEPTSVTPTVTATEGFADAWKTRLSSGASSASLPPPPIEGADFDTPGSVSVTESGFVNQEQLGVAGLADFGTRLRLTLSGPAGVTAQLPTQIALAPAGSGTTIEGQFQMVQSASGLYNPTQGQSVSVSLSGATTTVVYEVVSSTATALELANIPVTVSVPSGTPPGAVVAELSYAPISAVPVVAGPGPIPQFVDTGASFNIANIVECQSATTLAISDGAGNPWSPGGEPYGTLVNIAAGVTGQGTPIPAGTLEYDTYLNGGCTGSAAQQPTVDVTNGIPAPYPGTPALVPAGTYSVQAVYSGDANYTGSSSSCQTFTVNQDPTGISTQPLDEGGSGASGDSYHDTATVSVSPSTAAAASRRGSNGGLRPQILGSVRQQPGNAPSGTVTFSLYSGTCSLAGASSGTLLDTYPAASVGTDGSASSPSSGPLDAGSYYYQAAYTGDGNYTGSASSCEPFTIAQASAVLATKTVDENGSGVTGDSYHDTATATGLVPVTGTVTFTLYTGTCPSPSAEKQGVNAGTAVSAPDTEPLSDGTATSKSSGPLAAGDYYYLALYGGDANYTTGGSGCEPFSVEPALLTVTASSALMTYGSPVSKFTPSYSGLIPGFGLSTFSSLPVCGTAATSASPAGQYTTSCSGAVAPDYSISYVAGTLTDYPAPLTVVAPPLQMSYGGAVPTVRPIYLGFVLGQNSSALTAKPVCAPVGVSRTSPVGSYAISCGGAVDPNYAISYTSGALGIVPAPLTITASSPQMTYGGALPAIMPIYAGFVLGQGPASLRVVPNCSASRVGTVPAAGTYTTSCGGAIDPNYAFSYSSGVLSVRSAALTVTADSTFMLAGGPVPGIVPLYAGFVDHETPAVLTAAPVCRTTATATSPPGVYPTSCQGAVDANYSIRYLDGVLTVGQRAGYRLEGGDGGVFDFRKSFVGSVPPPSLGLHIFDFAAMASTATGYWLVERTGGVFAFGSARYLGSLPGEGVHVDDIVGVAATPDGGGYWMLSATGHVYRFGDAGSLGDASSLHRTDFVSITTQDARGYLLLTASGAVYSFGDARSLGDCRQARSGCAGVIDIVGMALARTAGYWLTSRNGAVYSFGSVTTRGSCVSGHSGCAGVNDVVGIASPDDLGYWLAEADGNVIGFGDAQFYGRCGNVGSSCAPLVRPIVAINP